MKTTEQKNPPYEISDARYAEHVIFKAVGDYSTYGRLELRTAAHTLHSKLTAHYTKQLNALRWWLVLVGSVACLLLAVVIKQSLAKETVKTATLKTPTKNVISDNQMGTIRQMGKNGNGLFCQLAGRKSRYRAKLSVQTTQKPCFCPKFFTFYILPLYTSSLRSELRGKMGLGFIKYYPRA